LSICKFEGKEVDEEGYARSTVMKMTLLIIMFCALPVEFGIVVDVVTWELQL
jgi:hypothetical protein